MKRICVTTGIKRPQMVVWNQGKDRYNESTTK